jgi:hypothetical protein
MAREDTASGVQNSIKEIHDCYIDDSFDFCDDATSFRAASFSDMVSNELILICISSYLPASSLLFLSSTNTQIRSIMLSTPGVWRTIDLSDLNPPKSSLLKFLCQSHVLRDCHNLILDGVDVPHEFIDQILLRAMPRLHSISLRSCPNLNGDQIIKLIGYIRRISAPRPLSLRYISLIGAPLLPLNQPSYYAPAIVAAAGSEILTDIHSLQCCGKDHLDLDLAERRWHLKNQYPNHPCVECLIPQELCMKCHVKKTCVGCHSFYCDNCEPHPEVLPSPLRTVTDVEIEN